MTGKKRYGAYTKFVAYMVIIILINLAGITLFFRWDLTANNIYSLSEASKKAVSTLSEPLTINVFFTKILPAPYNNTETYLHDLLKEYSIYGKKYFNYRFYDVSADEGDMSSGTTTNRALAESYGIDPVQIQAYENDEVKFQKVYMGLALVHGDMVEKIPTITSSDRVEYKVTTAIERLNNKVSALLRLSDTVKVKLYLSSSMEIVAPYMKIDGMSALPEKIKDIVEKLNKKNYGKLEFIHIDPSKEDTPENDLQKYNIPTITWPDAPDKNLKAGKGAIGIVMEYGEKRVNIPLLNAYTLPLMGAYYKLAELDKMDEVIDSNLESLININEELGYISDHGSQSLWGGIEEYSGTSTQDSLSNFREIASQTYNIKEIELSKDTIPEGINTLIIAGPKENFTDYDLFQIDQFLMKGKNLALFIDSFTEGSASAGQLTGSESSYTPLKTGLERLLEHYGVSIKTSYVMDENCYKQELQQSSGGGYQKLYFIPIIDNININKDLTVMKDIKGLVMSKVSPLEVKADVLKANNIKDYPLFSSSDKAWEMKDSITLDPYAIEPPSSESEFKSMPLAYMLEGEFTSYFKDKSMPEKELNQEKESVQKDGQVSSNEKAGSDISAIRSETKVIGKGSKGKIFIIGSSEILKDYIFDSGGSQPNSVFVMNMIDYLNGRAATAVMRGKENSYNPLAALSGGGKTFIKFFNIIGLPVLVVLFGIMIFFRRRQRKKMIQMMFKK